MKTDLVRRIARYGFITLLFSAAVLLCGPGTPRKAWARASGISGYSGKTAFTCTTHHSSTGTPPTVALTGPAGLAAGSSGAYTLTITGGAAGVGGLDVATSAGTLQASGDGTMLLNGEVTHTAPAPFSNDALAFTFTLIAPSAAGPLTLYASGLSGNGDNSASGDNSSKTSLSVDVTAAPTVNNPPSAPALISPANGQTNVETTATFQWTRSTDPDSDPITYHLTYCPDSTLTTCAPVDVVFHGLTRIYFAGAGLLFLGFVFIRNKRLKARALMLIIAVLIMTGSLSISCKGGGGDGGSIPDISHQVSGLNGKTTYYWNVVADDGKGGLASSQTWSFTTQ
jgi:hypothetical protein